MLNGLHGPLLRRRTTNALPARTRFTSGTRGFHASVPRRAEAHTPNHYQILSISQTATAAEIKKQFFTLSKTHHPDKNPNDPTASAKFVAISEAYHTLSVPEKRAQYDAQLSEQQGSSRWGRSGGQHPQGSYSSASYAGSRPATGLNKKRGTFRGPPPSFYKSGGYGSQGAKRTEYTNYTHTNSQAADQEAEGSYGQYGGFGPGQTRQGNEVPHFNERRHKTMHDHINDHINARRQERAAELASQRVSAQLEREGSTIVNFLLVTGVLGLIGVFGWAFGGNEERRRSKDSS